MRYFFIVIASTLLWSCSSKRSFLELACSQVDTVNEGYLLVRLQTQSNKIDALIQMQDTSSIGQLRQNIEREHEVYKDAFSKLYSFGKVLFYYDYDSELLNSGSFKSLKLLDHNSNEVLASEVLTKNNYLILAYGPIYDAQLMQASGERHISLAGTYSSEGLVVKDRNNIQLLKPFPYGFRAFSNSKSINNAVESLNINLIKLKSRCLKRGL